MPVVTKEKEQRILALLKTGHLSGAIAKIENVSQRTVGNYARKHGLSRKMGQPRLYTLNQNYFKNIDTEEKAYWMGFCMLTGI